MSDNRARYVVEGVDGVSAPFRRAQGSAQGLKGAMRELAREARASGRALGRTSALGSRGDLGGRRDFGSEVAQLGRRLRGELRQSNRGGRGGGRPAPGQFLQALGGISASVTAALGILDHIADVAGVAGSLAMSVGGALIDEALFQERTMASLTQAFGDATTARREFRAAVRLAAQTPMSTQDFVELSTQLATAGVSGHQADQLRAFLTDMSAIRGSEASQRGLVGIRQMLNAGRVRQQDVNQITDNLGLSQRTIAATIGRNRGMQGSDAAIARQVMATMAHRTTAEEYINAAMQTHARGGRSQGNMRELGTLSQELGQGLAGQWSNLRDLPRVIFGETSKSAGLQIFTRGLRNVNELLSDTSGLGGRLSRLVNGLTNDVFGALFGSMADRESARTTLTQVTEVLESLRPTVRAIAQDVRTFAEGFGGGFMESWRALHASDTGGMEQQTQSFRDMGRAMGELAASLLAVVQRYRELVQLYQQWRALGNFLSNPVQGVAGAAGNAAAGVFGMKRDANDAGPGVGEIFTGEYAARRQNAKTTVVQYNQITVQAAPEQHPAAVGAAVQQAAAAGVAARGG